MIKETIVVEGKSDMIAVKKAVKADIIVTGGMGFTKEILELIRVAQIKRGVIILTDPDFAGEKIRSIISKKVPGVKHAFVPLEEAQDEGDIGVENASSESIRQALSMAKEEISRDEPLFDMIDMYEFGLTGSADSKTMRRKVGKLLGIGYTNSKQFLNRLNIYGVSFDELSDVYKKLKCNDKKDE